MATAKRTYLFKPNKWHYREKTRYMPRMKNLPPYDSNEITKWFSELYGCDQPRAAKHFDAARILSTNSFRDNPDKWPSSSYSITKPASGTEPISHETTQNRTTMLARNVGNLFWQACRWEECWQAMLITTYISNRPARTLSWSSWQGILAENTILAGNLGNCQHSPKALFFSLFRTGKSTNTKVGY
jgi:hypothetical protein